MRSFSTAWYMLVHTRLYVRFGDPHWWPGETPFEVAAGAILTQNTAWSNVEKAIANLKKEGMLQPESICRSSLKRIAELVHPTGYRNQKAGYLKVLSEFVVNDLDGDIASLSEWETDGARRALLLLKGIGEETADSILCYAASKPVFVVDAYTKRIFSRMHPEEFLRPTDGNVPGYDEVRSMVMENLRGDTLLYNRFHALLVILAKENCRAAPLCNGCPLLDICRTGEASLFGNE